MSRAELETIAEHRCFGGTLGYYRHQASTTRCPMRFSLYTPPQAAVGQVPVVWWLSGLTCTEDNFTVKAGAYKKAAELGLMIVAPDTSPRGDDVPNDDTYDFGQGAGFYVDATEAPWDTHFQMYSYVTQELPELVYAHFPGDAAKQAISGHSMGGHGALTIGLKNPDTYKSISAFSPICAPTQCPWGKKALKGYLGADTGQWADYDACQLMLKAGDRTGFPAILIDQGTADQFLEDQLMPQMLIAAADDTNQLLELRMLEGYDHSYFFIASFIDDHLAHHKTTLG